MRDMLSQEIGDGTDLKAPLETAFTVLAKFASGEPVEDDEIEEARATCQRALFDTALETRR